MDENLIRQRMEKILEIFRMDIATIRTGRAHPSLIENLIVTVYAGQQKLKLVELGTIMVQDARTIVFQPWDASLANEIKNGILASGMGLTAVSEQGAVRIIIPTLTTEQRQDYIKLLGKKTEGIRVMVRDVRAQERRILQDQLQAKQISEDQFRQSEEKLQKLTDEYIAKVEEIEKKKEEEIIGGTS